MDLAGALFSCFAAIFCGLYVWNAFVSKYWLNLPPSPWPLPLIGHLHLLVGGLPHLLLRELSKAYGPVFLLRFGAKQLVVVSSPDLAKEVLRTHDHAFASRPYTLMGDIISYNFRGMGMAPYSEHWKDKRKLCNTELFATKRIDSSLSLRMEELQNLLMAIRNSGRRPVNMRELLAAYSFNVMTQLLISKRYYSLNSSTVSNVAEAEEFVHVSKQIAEQGFQFHVSDYAPKYLRWMDWTAPAFWRLHHQQDKFLQKLVDERKAEANRGVENFMDVILKHTGDDPAGEDTTKALIMDLFLGGTETSSTIIEWALAELLNTPHALAAAQDEIKNVVGSKAMVEESDFAHLEYCQAVVKEVFRLHPPLALLVPHAAIQTCKLGGYGIPKDAVILINAYALARDPLVWEDPDEFKPERFLGKGKEIDVKGQHYELLPFGSGRRVCPGMTLGLKTVHLVLFNLIHSFDWSTATGKKCDLEEAHGTVAWLKTPLEPIADPRRTKN